MAIEHPYPNPVADPNFYCHGQKCIDGGCTPLHCDEQPDTEVEFQDEADQEMEFFD